jgi:succinate-semialdehyde dehydrogenase/glutarate-semialdehyde dehydrogenase
MTSTAATTGHEASRPTTVGGVVGAPSAARATQLVGRAAGGQDSAPVAITAPFTGLATATLPQATDADARKVFGEARKAQRAWAARPVRERQQVLTWLHDLILDQQDEILDLVQLEAGKARIDAFDEVTNPTKSRQTPSST